MRAFSCLAVAALLFGACGGGGAGNEDAGLQEDTFHQWDVNHPPQQDGPQQQDSGPVTCLASTSYGTLGTLEGYVDTTLGDPDRIVYFGALNADTKPDFLYLDFWNGYGVFANGINPGTYQLTGAETAWETCGACVLIQAEYDMNAGGYKQD